MVSSSESASSLLNLSFTRSQQEARKHALIRFFMKNLQAEVRPEKLLRATIPRNE